MSIAAAAASQTRRTAPPPAALPKLPWVDDGLSKAVWGIYWNTGGNDEQWNKGLGVEISRGIRGVGDDAVANGLRDRLYDLSKLKNNLGGGPKSGVDLQHFRAFFADPKVMKALSPQQRNQFLSAANNLVAAGGLRGAPAYKSRDLLPSSVDRFEAPGAYEKRAQGSELGRQVMNTVNGISTQTSDADFESRLVNLKASPQFQQLTKPQQGELEAGLRESLAMFRAGTNGFAGDEVKKHMDQVHAHASRLPPAVGAGLEQLRATYQTQRDRATNAAPLNDQLSQQAHQKLMGEASQVLDRTRDMKKYLDSINGVTMAGGFKSTLAQQIVKRGNELEAAMALPDSNPTKNDRVRTAMKEANGALNALGRDPVEAMKSEREYSKQFLDRAGDVAGWIPGPIGMSAKFAFKETGLAYDLWAHQIGGREFAGKTMMNALDSVFGGKVPGPKGMVADALRTAAGSMVKDLGDRASEIVADPRYDTPQKKLEALGRAVKGAMVKAYGQALVNVASAGGAAKLGVESEKLVSAFEEAAKSLGVDWPTEDIRKKLSE